MLWCRLWKVLSVSGVYEPARLRDDRYKNLLPLNMRLELH